MAHCLNKMLVFIFFISTISASCIFNLGGSIFDFSRLIGQDIKYEIGGGPGYFRVSVCTNLMDPCMNGLSPMAVPQFGSLYRYSAGFMCKRINQWNPVNMLIAPLTPLAQAQAEFGTGVTFLFVDPIGCNGKPMTTQYNMMCDSGSDTGHVSVTQASPCSYNVNWPTKQACVMVAPGTRPRMLIPPKSFPLPPKMDVKPQIVVTEKPVFPALNPPESFVFFGDFLGNATCAEPAETCFASVQSMNIQLECQSCNSCAIVAFAGGKFYSGKIQADVCEGNVLAGNLVSKEGLNGYVYLHSYHLNKAVKGTLDIEPFQSSKYDLKLELTIKPIKRLLRL